MTIYILPELASAINAAHDRAFRSAKSAVGAAVECGELLLQAKAQIEHGEWLFWLQANTHISIRQSQKYMRLARAAAAGVKYDSDSHLTLETALSLTSERKDEPEPDPPSDTIGIFNRRKHVRRRDEAITTLATRIQDVAERFGDKAVVEATNSWQSNIVTRMADVASALALTAPRPKLEVITAESRNLVVILGAAEFAALQTAAATLDQRPEELASEILVTWLARRGEGDRP
jgi:Protein of unknown function (DUF3102)